LDLRTLLVLTKSERKGVFAILWFVGELQGSPLSFLFFVSAASLLTIFLKNTGNFSILEVKKKLAITP